MLAIKAILKTVKFCMELFCVCFSMSSESCHGLSRLNIYSHKGMNKISTKNCVLFSAHSLYIKSMSTTIFKLMS